MGPLSAAGSWGGSSNLKVAIRSQSREAYDETPPTCWCGAAVPGEDQRLPGEGGQQLLAVGTGPGLGQPGRGFDRWSFVSGVPLSGGAAKQISPQPSFLS